MGISVHVFMIFFGNHDNFQCVSLVILIHQWQSILLILTLLKGNCFLNSFSDYYLLVYTAKTAIIYFYQFGQLDSCLYFLIYLLCLTPSLSHFFKDLLFFNIKLFLAMPALVASHRAVAVSRGCSLVAVPRLLIAMASLVAELGLWSVQASIVMVQGLSCPGIWTLLGPEMEPLLG